MRSERFYYDGARRIQEVVTDPLVNVETLNTPEGSSNNPELSEMLDQSVSSGTIQSSDGSANPASFESGQMANPAEAIGIGGDPLPETLSGVEREYVWGPGDNGLDELLVQYDNGRKPWWMIQDSGGDVVAMCDLDSSNNARVVHTWQYDAYGTCVGAAQLVTNTSTYKAPVNRCGHKGLFLDRLDVGLADPNTYADNPRLAPNSIVLYQNRNRTYSPQLGRFIQRDPNESGQVLATGHSYDGVRTPKADVNPFDLEFLYAESGSIHSYLHSAPWAGRDPTGLFDFNLVSLLGVSTSIAELESDYAMDMINTGVTISQSIQERFADAADENWQRAAAALDWDAPDEAVGIEIPSVNSGSEAPSGPAMAGFAWNANRWHHLATKYGSLGKRFRSIFRNCGVHIDDSINLMKIQWRYHKGAGHSKKYWDKVTKALERAERLGKIARSAPRGPAKVAAKKAAKEALEEGLAVVRAMLEKDPSILRP